MLSLKLIFTYLNIVQSLTYHFPYSCHVHDNRLMIISIIIQLTPPTSGFTNATLNVCLCK